MDISVDVLAQSQQLATTITENAWLWTGNFLALIVLTVIFLFFAMKGGRSGLISFILALYAGYAIYVVFPYTDFIVAMGGTAPVKAILSLVIFGAATFLPFIVIRRLTGGGFGSLTFIPNLILSFLAAAFLLVLGYHVFDISNIYQFSQPLDQLFAPEGFFFWWFIAPLIGLFLLAR
ncbi:MAG: hypothetical protein AAB440_01165 [Patescibacteria group bacterium]